MRTHDDTRSLKELFIAALKALFGDVIVRFELPWISTEHIDGPDWLAMETLEYDDEEKE
ncbi:MAG: hypothetical protein ACXAEB_15800 [Candidatus Thorarchaeota archaeon]|jgi:hypothetical protein